ncbi:MAG: EamA family transporter RarD [Bacillota bacterium]|nr:EamA family transporter RarD [Bacillota bacterium]
MKKLDKNALCVFLCYVLWGVLPVYWKLLSRVDSVYVLASRIIWSFVFSIVIVSALGKWKEVRAVLGSRGQCIRLLLCGVMITINWGSYIYAVNAGHILDASLAYYLNPIISIFIGFLVFKESLSVIQWISVLIAATGIIVPIIGYGQMPVMALVIGGSFALYSMLKREVTADSSVSMLMETGFVLPFAILFIVFMESGGKGAYGVLSGKEWLLLPLAGVVTTIPLLLFAKGIRHISMSLAGILMYVNPTLQLLLGAVVYKEKITVTEIFMFTCVWTALILFCKKEI